MPGSLKPLDVEVRFALVMEYETEPGVYRLLAERSELIPLTPTREGDAYDVDVNLGIGAGIRALTEIKDEIDTLIEQFESRRVSTKNEG